MLEELIWGIAKCTDLNFFNDNNNENSDDGNSEKIYLYRVALSVLKYCYRHGSCKKGVEKNKIFQKQ